MAVKWGRAEKSGYAFLRLGLMPLDRAEEFSTLERLYE